jgi:hypothetical protein
MDMTEYWTMKSGHRISVDDMTEEHVRNTLKMIIRVARINSEKRMALKERLLRTFKEDEALELELEQRDEI